MEVATPLRNLGRRSAPAYPHQARRGMSQHQASALELRDLLVIEDDPALLDFRCSATELPLWPQIRVALFRMRMSDLFYGVRLTGTSNAAKSWIQATTTMLRSLAHNAQQLCGEGKHARICITSDGVADQWVDGQWFNRLSDHFVAARPADSLVLADHFEWRWPFPRHFDRLVLHAPWQAMNAIRGRISIRTTHHRQACDLVQLVAERAQQYLGWRLDNERRTALVQMLARKTASMPWQYSAYARLLTRIRPELLMVGAGCYGPAASLIAAAKSLDICTAEYQHGAVSAGHDAYNFAPAIRDSAVYQRTLPEHFLGYGKWWIDQINAPVKKWAIGNPHRAARMREFGAKKTAQKDLLILSDGIEFDLYLNLARRLCGHAKALGLRVVLRPHPLERTRVLQMSAAEMVGFQIDSNADLYHSLRAAHTVVSEVSTGLFEAVGMVERILIWDTPKSRFGYPQHPFNKFDSVDALVEGLIGSEGCVHEVTMRPDEIWAKDWRLNFDQFLVRQGVSHEECLIS